jgi:hypothetical protein
VHDRKFHHGEKKREFIFQNIIEALKLVDEGISVYRALKVTIYHKQQSKTE